MRELRVDKKFNNKKLQDFLMSNFNGLSTATFFKTLRKKDIKVNQKRINENITVFENDIINIYLKDIFLFKTIKLNIVYEDNNILIVDKPQDIEVLNDSTNSLTSIIQDKYNFGNNFPFPCHRLDRNTSGLIIFAKNQESLDVLNVKIQNHEISKFYRCTVIGILDKKEALLRDFLFKDNKKSFVYINSISKKGYREILTSYKVIKENKKDNLSILEVELHTGRTHQIRAHLAFIGHPILGDGKYR